MGPSVVRKKRESTICELNAQVCRTTRQLRAGGLKGNECKDDGLRQL